ncbi:hypothetical protein MTAT_08880 [Moorella thermoacetica]|uniref:Uncharacterized protein n=1 Tax=Neomoorella thermoacetica TaxID=1525 RepID=A0AAC9HJI6_NEOTH|nr:hypothetical protein Maut_01809 [Moorella thermoacetica]TYL14653.1 hypothetical protein MTAT_08880 [Moorella thermoacetica]
MGADATAMNNENVSDRGWGYRRRATWFEALANSAKPQGGGGERDGDRNERSGTKGSTLRNDYPKR